MTKMNRREFMGATVAAMALPQARTLPARPNVIFILADDMGYGDLSSYGRPDYKTPVLDGMAEEGIKFTDNYAAAAVCTPTRVGFLTGRYPSGCRSDCRNPYPMRTIHSGFPWNIQPFHHCSKPTTTTASSLESITLATIRNSIRSSTASASSLESSARVRATSRTGILPE